MLLVRDALYHYNVRIKRLEDIAVKVRNVCTRTIPYNYYV